MVTYNKSILTETQLRRECKTCDTPLAFWRHVLNRNHFSFDQQAGQLDRLKITCQNSIVTVAYEPELSWTVNRQAGDCHLEVVGENDTSFRLIELP